MNDPVDELTAVLADVRRQLRASDVEETRQLADLTDGTLVWLLANHWVPPAAPAPTREVPRSGWGDSFILTEGQYLDYKRAVREAQQVKDLLYVEEARDARSDRVVVLRAEIRRRAEGIKAMTATWRPE